MTLRPGRQLDPSQSASTSVSFGSSTKMTSLSGIGSLRPKGPRNGRQFESVVASRFAAEAVVVALRANTCIPSGPCPVLAERA